MPSKTSNLPTLPQPWKAESTYAEGELLGLASTLAGELKPGDLVFLDGPMGAGKSTFARALMKAIGIAQPAEGSPTFAIAHEYTSRKGEVIHIDFYRLKSEEEIEEAGLLSYFWERNAIVLSEWLSSWPDLQNQIIESKLGLNTCWLISLDFAEEDPLKESGKLRKIFIRKMENS